MVNKARREEEEESWLLYDIMSFIYKWCPYKLMTRILAPARVAGRPFGSMSVGQMKRDISLGQGKEMYMAEFPKSRVEFWILYYANFEYYIMCWY